MVSQHTMWPSTAGANGQMANGAASRHTIAPVSHTRPSPRSRQQASYCSFPVLLRVGGWVGMRWAHSRLATCVRLLAMNRVWVEPTTSQLRVRYSTSRPIAPSTEIRMSCRNLTEHRSSKLVCWKPVLLDRPKVERSVPTIACIVAWCSVFPACTLWMHGGIATLHRLCTWRGCDRICHIGYTYTTSSSAIADT